MRPIFFDKNKYELNTDPHEKLIILEEMESDFNQYAQAIVAELAQSDAEQLNLKKWILRQTLHNFAMLRVSQKQCWALKELKVSKVEAGCYSAGNQGEAVFF